MTHRTLPVFMVAAATVLAACAHGLPGPELQPFDMRDTPNASAHPDSPAVILLDRGILEFAFDAERGAPIARLEKTRRLKILRDDGLAMGNIEVVAERGTVIVGLTARVVHPSGEIVAIEREDAMSGVDAIGRRSTTLRGSDVTTGCVVEWAYTTYIEDPRFVAPWRFQSALPTVRSEFVVVVPKTFDVSLRYSVDGSFVDNPPQRFETEFGTRHSWSASDVPPIFPEPSMPSAELLAPTAHVILSGARANAPNIRGFSSWDDVAAWFSERSAPFMVLSSAAKTRAREIAGDVSPREKSLRIVEFVEKNIGREPPVPLMHAPLEALDGILTRRSGNDVVRGLLVVALARAAGVPVEMALAARRTRAPRLADAPLIAALDSVVGVLRQPERTLVLDPTQATISADVPSPELQDTRVIVVSDSGATLLDVPRSSADASTTTVHWDLRMDDAGNIDGTFEARLAGAEAGVVRALLGSADPERHAEILERHIASRGATHPIDGVTFADLDELRRPLLARGTIRRQSVTLDDGSSTFIRIGQLLGGDAEPLRETRRTPLVLGAPHTARMTATLTLPDGWTSEFLPDAIRETWDEGELQLALRAETTRRIGLSKTTTVRTHTVLPSGYPEYRRFRTAARKVDDQTLALTRAAPPQPARRATSRKR